MLTILALAATLAVEGAVFKAPAENPATATRAIERALVFLEGAGEGWIEKKGCVSCHHTGFLIWSHVEAGRRGIAVDALRLESWTDWALGQQLTPGDEGVAPGSRNLEGLSQLVLGRNRRPPVEDVRAKELARLVELIASGRQADGTWKPGGQLPTQKRPILETTEVSSMWALLALLDRRVAESQARVSVDSARSRALAFLDKSSVDGKSTEWWALRLQLAARLDDAERKSTFLKALLERQNADGGWSWLDGDPSDALGTGQALYGLLEAGLDGTHPASGRAIEFLVRTQQADGSWSVKSTKAAKRDKALGTSIFLGSAWAVIGLARSLPETARPAERRAAF